MVHRFQSLQAGIACFSLSLVLAASASAQDSPPLTPSGPEPAAPEVPPLPADDVAAAPDAAAPADAAAPPDTASPPLPGPPAPSEPLAPPPAAPPVAPPPAVQSSAGPPAAAPPPPASVVTPPPAPVPAGNSSGGFLDFNFYPYLTEVDSDTVFTLNASSKLPFGFSYASLLNVANQAGAAPFKETNGYYTEQNLRWALPGGLPFDLTAQYNMRGGEDNDRMRFGVRARFDAMPVIGTGFKAIGLTYSITFHMLQIDHEEEFVWQMEHIFRLDTPYLDRRLYVAGFIDHTFNQNVPNVPKNPFVLEAQAGVRLFEELYAIAEYRINQYRAGDEDNLALGGEYVIKW